MIKQKKFDKALTKAFKILDGLDDNNIIIELQLNFLIGKIFYQTSSYKNGIKYFRRNINIISRDTIPLENNNNLSVKNNISHLQNLLKLGSSYHKLKEIDTIKRYKDSALFFYKKVVNIRGLSSEILDQKAIAYNNLAAFFINDTLYDKAKVFANKSIDIHKSRNDKVNQAAAMGNLASIYLLQKKYKLAKETYLEGIELIKNDTTSNGVRFKSSLYFNLAWALRNLKDYKAYDYQEISYDIKDELRDSEYRSAIKKINAEYDFDSKKEILLEREENKRLKQQRTFWFVGVIALLIILSLVYIISLNKLKQKNLGLKLSQTELLRNQEIEKIKAESQAIILNATIDGKESERKQIAETLHDSVSALLSSANMHLQATKKQFNGDTPIEIKKTQQIIQEASHKVRDLSHNLVSSVLLKFGLNFAVRDLAEKFSNSDLTIDTEINAIRRYSQNFEIKVHNIILEFVNNIIKHSKANNALIQLKEVNKILFITISDDGVGFDKTKIHTKDGLGLNQIDARIQMMKGKFHIKSSKNNGTTISVEIPVSEIEELNLV
ncbi:tetratricopeptide repeat-containing sensor histidine kinase [Polaribacter sp.]|uniref:tetratricopeptide repeat-containing sensor histidine kinase n=1 Tax=Polaribacter sp. TaxID=1920175 RepID=UPI003F6D4251